MIEQFEKSVKMEKVDFMGMVLLTPLPLKISRMIDEGVSKSTPSFFYAQSPDFHKLGLCYSLKILYL